MISTYYQRVRINPGTHQVAVFLSLLLVSLVLDLRLPRTASETALPMLQGEAAITHLKEHRLYNSLQASLTEARYRVRKDEQNSGAYYASNPAQHLTARFTPEGVELISQRQTAPPTWRLGMKLVGYGYGERIIKLGAGKLTVQENRIDSARPAEGQSGTAVTEWYVNKAEGLEQGFTLPRSPAGESGGERLRLRLALSGELKAELAADEQRLWLKRSGGEVALSYGGLLAWDASGKELGSRMRVEDAEVWLEVDDAGAVYPVTIDPTFVEKQKLIASDAAGDDHFGFSVAISGTTIVVGAPGDDIGSNISMISQGSAYVFERQGQQWVEQQKLTASDGAPGDQFGFSVAASAIGLSANRASILVVGAYGDNTFQGSAYVFERQGQQWIEQQKLTASDGVWGEQFGRSVAINSNTTIVVGAMADSFPFYNYQGSAYVFARQGQQWIEQQKLTANDGADTDQFGSAVAISSVGAIERIVVGAVTDDIGSNFDQGSAYVFERPSGSSFIFRQKLTASDGAASDSFGISIAIRGTTIVVGAYGDDSQGSAYVFELQGGQWVEQQKLTASDGGAFEGFGFSLAFSGTTLIVGAPGDNQGSAYVFERAGASFVEQQKLSASDGLPGDQFGYSVAIYTSSALFSTSGIVVGAPVHTLGPGGINNQFHGSAYVFAP